MNGSGLRGVNVEWKRKWNTLRPAYVTCVKENWPLLRVEIGMKTKRRCFRCKREWRPEFNITGCLCGCQVYDDIKYIPWWQYVLMAIGIIVLGGFGALVFWMLITVPPY